MSEGDKEGMESREREEITEEREEKFDIIDEVFETENSRIEGGKEFEEVIGNCSNINASFLLHEFIWSKLSVT